MRDAQLTVEVCQCVLMAALIIDIMNTPPVPSPLSVFPIPPSLPPIAIIIEGDKCA